MTTPLHDETPVRAPFDEDDRRTHHLLVDMWVVPGDRVNPKPCVVCGEDTIRRRLDRYDDETGARIPGMAVYVACRGEFPLCRKDACIFEHCTELVPTEKKARRAA